MCIVFHSDSFIWECGPVVGHEWLHGLVEVESVDSEQSVEETYECVELQYDAVEPVDGPVQEVASDTVGSPIILHLMSWGLRLNCSEWACCYTC